MLTHEIDVISRKTILLQSSFFAQMNPRQLESVATLSQIISHTEGDILYKPGEPADIFYVLLCGTVNFALGYQGMTAPAGHILHPAAVFGWAALTEQAPQRIATATCLTDCLVLAIDGQDFLLLMEKDHDIGYYMMKQLNSLITSNLTAFAVA